MAEASKPSRATFPSISDLFSDEAHRQVAAVTLGITAMVVLSTAFPAQELELVLALTAAVAYGVRYSQQKLPVVKEGSRANGVISPSRSSMPPKASKPRCKLRTEQSPSAKEGFTPSVRPIAAPIFAANGWEAEVDELSTQIARTPEVDRLVQGIISAARTAIQLVIPEAEVIGLASGNPMFNKAYAMAVPEIHIVMKASTPVLLRRLESRYTRGGSISYKPDAKKLQKCAIRTCTEQLVSEAGFKFRRSAFVGDDPKVCLLVPPSLGLCTDSIAIDFSVNANTPLRSETVMTQSTSQDPRAEPLMLLVRRWARDRGIAHAAKGHLSTYAWNVLTVFFLQAAPECDSSIGPISAKTLAQPDAGPKEGCPQKSTAVLFRELVAFYANDFDWQHEGISVRLGHRAPPRPELPSHRVTSENGAHCFRPSIEDPFEVTRDLASGMSSAGASRLREELLRANELCSRGASLKELLELWAPPEVLLAQEAGR
eukprot:CAMPEP_0170590378 /NCGR_PEP_ID=MMETSP0224-20130122/11839_1 /TAXON_ID=285029 /ORGANISM="Togula jolla, Strain CCCM 725" /LENGTH=485 /DNA_ID=CAMNT_0010914173 /DNA_START=82 /DNA_END=1539 /DNA_ORIENTATION=-